MHSCSRAGMWVRAWARRYTLYCKTHMLYTLFSCSGYHFRTKAGTLVHSSPRGKDFLHGSCIFLQVGPSLVSQPYLGRHIRPCSVYNKAGWGESMALSHRVVGKELNKRTVDKCDGGVATPSSGTECEVKPRSEGKSGENRINRTQEGFCQGLWLGDPGNPTGDMLKKYSSFWGS